MSGLSLCGTQRLSSSPGDARVAAALLLHSMLRRPIVVLALDGVEGCRGGGLHSAVTSAAVSFKGSNALEGKL